MKKFFIPFITLIYSSDENQHLSTIWYILAKLKREKITSDFQFCQIFFRILQLFFNNVSIGELFSIFSRYMTNPIINNLQRIWLVLQIYPKKFRITTFDEWYEVTRTVSNHSHFQQSLAKVQLIFHFYQSFFCLYPYILRFSIKSSCWAMAVSTFENYPEYEGVLHTFLCFPWIKFSTPGGFTTSSPT